MLSIVPRTVRHIVHSGDLFGFVNLITATTWKYLQAIKRAGVDVNAPVFASRGGNGVQGGGALDPSQVDRIVRAVAVRAGIDAPVFAHRLRHARASHSMKHGATVHEVSARVGHSSVAITSMYLHVNSEEPGSRYLAI